MFLTHLKSLMQVAMQQTFDADFPEPDFRDVNVSIEYPVREQDYPAIWADFDISGDLESAGIDHREFAPVDPTSLETRSFKRWKYQGNALYTIVALTSFERDRLFDEVLRVIAFGDESIQTQVFRSYIEDNELIACNLNFDHVGVMGKAETPGTPWLSDDIIYQITVSIEAIGEFVSDGSSGTLVPISAIKVYGYSDIEPDPTDVPGDPGGWV